MSNFVKDPKLKSKVVKYLGILYWSNGEDGKDLKRDEIL